MFSNWTQFFKEHPNLSVLTEIAGIVVACVATTSWFYDRELTAVRSENQAQLAACNLQTVQEKRACERDCDAKKTDVRSDTLESLIRSEDPDKQLEAISVVVNSRRNDISYVPAVSRFADSPDANVKAEAAFALALMSRISPAAEARAVALLRDPAPVVRMLTLDGFAHSDRIDRPPAPVYSLLKQAFDNDSEKIGVRIYAAHAMLAVNFVEAPQYLHTVMVERSLSESALAATVASYAMPDEAIPQLLEPARSGAVSLFQERLADLVHFKEDARSATSHQPHFIAFLASRALSAHGDLAVVPRLRRTAEDETDSADSSQPQATTLRAASTAAHTTGRSTVPIET